MGNKVVYVGAGSELHDSNHLLKLLEGGAFGNPQYAYDAFLELEGEAPNYIYALEVVKRLEPKLTFE